MVQNMATIFTSNCRFIILHDLSMFFDNHIQKQYILYSLGIKCMDQAWEWV